ncbi:MAG TPA: ABC transporter permease [Euzebyales bacterium]|nr:ABC transporter permease [Euzebyales bacterium]
MRANRAGGNPAVAGRWRARLMLAPAALWFTLFLIAPLTVMLVVSFGERAPNGGYQPALTLAQYQELPTRLVPLVNTLRMGALGTVLCLLVAYPLAYYLATRAGSRRTLLLALIVIPLWTSFLIRTYAWMFLLGSSGLPRVFAALGVLEQVRLLNTPFAVLLGIVYNYLPLMALPIYVSLERLDDSLRQASKDLGAGPAGTFLQVTLPLSAPGVISGCLLVFIPVTGEYLIPVLLGGGQTYFLGNALADLFLQSRNWPFGAALATAFVALMALVIALYTYATRRLTGPQGEASLL